VPAKLGRGGVTEIVELDLNEDEMTQLKEAAEAIRSKCGELDGRTS
jgi:malate/lactate dehydrogenase